MAINPIGDIFYQDDYEAQYRTVWETVGDQLDVTSTISIPYVWGEEAKGFIKNGILFRWGLISITRQVLRTDDDGYEIVAEGGSQYCDYIQMNYPCQTGPSDPFAYHVDCAVSDQTEFRCTDGPCWADPDDPLVDCVWADQPEIDGTFQTLFWVDVWMDEELQADTIFHFDRNGNEDLRYVTLNNTIGFGDGVTVDFKFQVDNLTVNQRFMSRQTGGTDLFSLYVDTSGDLIMTQGLANDTLATGVTANVPHHITVSRVGNVVTATIVEGDAVSSGPQTVLSSSNGADFYGSNISASPVPQFDGFMWDITWTSGVTNDNVTHSGVSPDGFNDSNPIGVDNNGTITV
jgi:hypothetical protein